MDEYKKKETIEGVAFDGTTYKILVYPKSAYLRFSSRPNRDVIGAVKSLGGRWSGKFKSWAVSLSLISDITFNLNN